MGQDPSQSQVVELTTEFSGTEGVSFDPEHITLEGLYADQISAYRARKVWIDTLGQSFLLEHKHDFALRVCPCQNEPRFILRCEFLTACARYAFWRLTNNQAPEAQYIIETAHIPNAESRQDDFWQAPDLRVKNEGTGLAALGQGVEQLETDTFSIKSILKRIIDRLGKDPDQP